MKIVVKKWGNSAALRIPASIMAAAGLALDQPVDIGEEAGRIVIQPIRDPAYDIDALLEAITPENRHDAVDFGAPIASRNPAKSSP